jgi:hypothetical protein
MILNKFNLYIELLTFLTVRHSRFRALVAIMKTERCEEDKKQKMKSNTNKISNQHDVDRDVQLNQSEIYNSNQHENSKNLLSAATAPVRRKGPVATSTKQMAGYFTVTGIENEISLAESKWPCFALKELSDNAFDWLNDYYPIATSINRHSSTGSSINYNSRTSRYIALWIQLDQIPNDPDLTRVFRIVVRNSNVDQIEVFGQREGLEQIFDYTQWLSTKRHQHRITAGSLGDYLKRHGGMGYASWNNIARNGIGDSDSDDDNVQWEEPLIFRFNGSEYKVFIYYDRYRGQPESVIKYAGKSDAIDYTEVECALPVSRINCNGNGSDPVPLFDKLYQYYTWYKIPKADIKFFIDMRYDIWHITEEDD